MASSQFQQNGNMAALELFPLLMENFNGCFKHLHWKFKCCEISPVGSWDTVSVVYHHVESLLQFDIIWSAGLLIVIQTLTSAPRTEGQLQVLQSYNCISAVWCLLEPVPQEPAAVLQEPAEQQLISSATGLVLPIAFGELFCKVCLHKIFWLWRRVEIIFCVLVARCL